MAQVPLLLLRMSPCLPCCRRGNGEAEKCVTTLMFVTLSQDGGLGENMKVHKSQLEKDREKALALQAARKKSGHNPLTPYPVKVFHPQPQSLQVSHACQKKSHLEVMTQHLE